MSRHDEPDSRDWIPPDDMRSIFALLGRAREHASVGNKQAALEDLVDAVEALATHVAGDRGRRE
jgi:hypothetical protein